MMVLVIGFATFFLIFLVWRVWFLRDPDRTIPEGNSLLAPADGYITYVQPVRKGTLPIAIKNRREIPLTEISGLPELQETEGTLVGIYMTAFSVHRNRIPVSGEIVLKHHQKAPRNLSMVRMYTQLLLGREPYEEGCEFLTTNERLSIAIRSERGTIVVTQIADAWIDRIVARVDVGERVERGQQYGLIRFGSQVDLFIPNTFDVDVVVEPGQYVHAGTSVIAHRRSSPR